MLGDIRGAAEGILAERVDQFADFAGDSTDFMRYVGPKIEEITHERTRPPGSWGAERARMAVDRYLRAQHLIEEGAMKDLLADLRKRVAMVDRRPFRIRGRLSARHRCGESCPGSFRFPAQTPAQSAERRACHKAPKPIIILFNNAICHSSSDSAEKRRHKNARYRASLN
jgi:hypothetical protein